MDNKPKLKPERTVVSPDQRMQLIHIVPNASGDPSGRVFVKHVPDGFTVEKVGRGKWEVSWEETLTQTVKLTFGLEHVAGTKALHAYLCPNEKELKLLEEKGEEAFTMPEGDENVGEAPASA